MFLQNMTWRQIRSRVDANEDFIERNETRLTGEWRKAIKRIRPLPLCFYKAVKSHEKDEFLVIGNSFDGKKLGYVTFAAVPSEKGKQYVIIDKDAPDDELRDKVTPHFIKRYRERRLHVEDWSQEKIVAHFFTNNTCRVIVYTDPDDATTCVHATTQGIAICHRDFEKGFLEFKTYIDDSMLYSTQRMAKEKIMSKIPENISEVSEYYLSSILAELVPIAQDIYSKYKSGAADYLVFKKTNAEDEVKLDFKLKASKHLLEKNNYNKKKQKEEPTSVAVSMNLLCGNSPLLATFHRNELRGCKMEIRGNQNGKGRMILRRDGKIVIEYKGALKDGMPHGLGVMRCADGHTYDANWVDGDINGHCKHSYPDNKGYDEGIFNGMERNGMIHMHTPHFDAWSMFVNDERVGSVKIETPNFTYEGDFDDTMSGRGKLTFSDGLMLEGMFKRGMLKGKGKQTDVDGSIIEANFNKNLADGLGTLTEPDGTVYSGRFVDGDLDGYVQERKPDGSTRIVEFCYGDNMDDWDDEDFEDAFDDDELDDELSNK